METGSILAIAFVVLVPAAILWAIFLSRHKRTQKPAQALGIPQAMRPAPPDEVLEGPPRGINTWDQFSEPVGPLCVPG